MKSTLFSKVKHYRKLGPQTSSMTSCVMTSRDNRVKALTNLIYLLKKTLSFLFSFSFSIWNIYRSSQSDMEDLHNRLIDKAVVEPVQGGGVAEGLHLKDVQVLHLLLPPQQAQVQVGPVHAGQVHSVRRLAGLRLHLSVNIFGTCCKYSETTLVARD